MDLAPRAQPDGPILGNGYRIQENLRFEGTRRATQLTIFAHTIDHPSPRRCHEEKEGTWPHGLMILRNRSRATYPQPVAKEDGHKRAIEDLRKGRGAISVFFVDDAGEGGDEFPTLVDYTKTRFCPALERDKTHSFYANHKSQSAAIVQAHEKSKAKRAALEARLEAVAEDAADADPDATDDEAPGAPAHRLLARGARVASTPAPKREAAQRSPSANKKPRAAPSPAAAPSGGRARVSLREAGYRRKAADCQDWFQADDFAQEKHPSGAKLVIQYPDGTIVGLP